jgi:hypothetical protein
VLLRKSGGGKRDLYASLSEVDHDQVSSLARLLGCWKERFRVVGLCGTAHQPFPHIVDAF